MTSISTKNHLQAPPAMGALRITQPANERQPVEPVTPQPIEVAAQKPNKYKSEPSSAELQGAVQAIRNRLGGPLSELQFTVDKDSGRSVIKVMDKNSREVLLQIPSEVALRISSELERFQKGLVLNKSA